MIKIGLLTLYETLMEYIGSNCVQFHVQSSCVGSVSLLGWIVIVSLAANYWLMSTTTGRLLSF